MKKIMLGILISLSTIGSTFALNMSSDDSQSYRINQGSVTILPLNIKVASDGEINKLNGFTLILNSDSNMRFDPSFISNIQASGSAINKVNLNKVTIKSDMLSLHFPVTSDFVNGDTLTLSGINIIVYGRERGYQNISIDINGDDIGDFADFAGIRILNLAGYQDTLSPAEVFDLTGTLEGNNLNLSWTNPGDIDFQVVRVQTLDKNKSLLTEKYAYGANYVNFTYSNDIAFVKVQTIDFKSNTSTGIVLPIEKFIKPSSQIGTSGTTTYNTGTALTGVTSNTGSLSTNTGDNGVVSNNNSSSQSGAINNFVERYTPTFSKDYLASFMLKFDLLINKKIIGFASTKANHIIDVRNKIIQALELYDKGQVSTQATILTLKVLIVDFNNAFAF